MLLIIERVAILKSSEMFHDTPEHVLVAVAEIAEEVTLDSGITFINKGEAGDRMYIVVDGMVRVYDGDTTFAEVGRGAVVGEMNLFTHKPRVASVATVGTAHLMFIDRDAFEEAMADRVEIAQALIKMLAERLELANQRIAQMERPD